MSVPACRACLATDRNLYNLNGKLQNDLQNLLGIEIAMSPDLPGHICYICRYMIHKYLSFKQKCVQTQMLLKKQVIFPLQTKETLEQLHSFCSNLDLSITNTKINSYDNSNTVYHDHDISKQKFDYKVKMEYNVDIYNEFDNNYNDADFDFNDGNNLSDFKEELGGDNDYLIEKDKSKTNIETGILKTDKLLKENLVLNNGNKGFELKIGDTTVVLKKCPKQDPKEQSETTKVINVEESDKNNGTGLDLMNNKVPQKEKSKKDKTVSMKKMKINFPGNFKSIKKCPKQDLKEQSGTTKVINVEESDKNNGTGLDLMINKVPQKEKSKNDKTVSMDKIKINFPGNFKSIKEVLTECGEAVNIKKSVKKKRNKEEPTDMANIYECDACSVKFYNAEAMKEHLNTCSDGTQSHCQWCGRGFKVAEALRNHCKLYHRKKKNNHEIKEEQKVEYQKGAIKIKMDPSINPRSIGKPMSMSLPGSYICEKCGKTFVNGSGLTNHVKTHAPTGQHACALCPRTYYRHCELVSHQTVHTGERPYKCDECGVTFRLKVYLIRHKRIHTGEKPHACEICGRRFNKDYNMKIHIRAVHRGEQTRKKRDYTKKKELSENTG